MPIKFAQTPAPSTASPFPASAVADAVASAAAAGSAAVAALVAGGGAADEPPEAGDRPAAPTSTAAGLTVDFRRAGSECGSSSSGNHSASTSPASSTTSTSSLSTSSSIDCEVVSSAAGDKAPDADALDADRRSPMAVDSVSADDDESLRKCAKMTLNEAANDDDASVRPAAAVPCPIDAESGPSADAEPMQTSDDGRPADNDDDDEANSSATTRSNGSSPAIDRATMASPKQAARPATAVDPTRIRAPLTDAHRHTNGSGERRASSAHSASARTRNGASGGGRLQFFKDGKFILELATSGSGDRSGWVSVPHKSYWPAVVTGSMAPATITATATTTSMQSAVPASIAAVAAVAAAHLALANGVPAAITNSVAHQQPISVHNRHNNHETSNSLSFSDDTSSVQSSPWQRDHCWKQSRPRRHQSAELALFFRRPRGHTLTIRANRAARRCRRRPHHRTASEQPDGPSDSDFIDVESMRCYPGDESDPAKSTSETDPSQTFQRRQHSCRTHRRTHRPSILDVVRRLGERLPPDQPAPLATTPPGTQPTLQALQQQSANHNQHVSPRKRILRELEKVSQLDNTDCVQQKRSKPKAHIQTDSIPVAPVFGATHHSHGPPHTPPSRPISSYSITSLLGHSSNSGADQQHHGAASSGQPSSSHSSSPPLAHHQSLASVSPASALHQLSVSGRPPSSASSTGSAFTSTQRRHSPAHSAFGLASPAHQPHHHGHLPASAGSTMGASPIAVQPQYARSPSMHSPVHSGAILPRSRSPGENSASPETYASRFRPTSFPNPSGSPKANIYHPYLSGFSGSRSSPSSGAQSPNSRTHGTSPIHQPGVTSTPTHFAPSTASATTSSSSGAPHRYSPMSPQPHYAVQKMSPVATIPSPNTAFAHHLHLQQHLHNIPPPSAVQLLSPPHTHHRLSHQPSVPHTPPASHKSGQSPLRSASGSSSTPRTVPKKSAALRNAYASPHTSPIHASPAALSSHKLNGYEARRRSPPDQSQLKNAPSIHQIPTDVHSIPVSVQSPLPPMPTAPGMHPTALPSALELQRFYEMSMMRGLVPHPHGHLLHPHSPHHQQAAAAAAAAVAYGSMYMMPSGLSSAFLPPSMYYHPSIAAAFRPPPSSAASSAWLHHPQTAAYQQQMAAASASPITSTRSFSQPHSQPTSSTARPGISPFEQHMAQMQHASSAASHAIGQQHVDGKPTGAQPTYNETGANGLAMLKRPTSLATATNGPDEPVALLANERSSDVPLNLSKH